MDNEFSKVLPDVPMIMGSVVHVHDGKTVNIHPYSRKLKMLRAELFSLLTICQSSKIIN